MDPAIEIENLGVTLGDRTILRAVSARIAPGEFVGIFGPNGAGKSTLIRCLVGTLAPGQGRIRIFGHPRSRGTSLIGYMPQHREGWDPETLSGRALVAAVLEGTRWGLPSLRRSRQRIDRALELAGVGTEAERPFSVLSGGERQRIRLAQALLGEPRILILDEPLAGLDPANQVQLIKQISRIQRETETTVLFVAHDMNPLLQVMNRVLYLAGGGAALGALEEVVTSEKLTALYGIPIDVVRAEGRVFILTAEGNVTEQAHHD